MQDIAGIPYIEAEFDKQGALQRPVALPPGVTDLIVVSHGWNNNADEARSLYKRLFESFVAVAQPGDLDGRSLAILGVVWPSKAFDELVAAAGAATSATGAAGLAAADARSLLVLEDKLERMKTFFTEPDQQRTIDEVKALLPTIEERATDRRLFVEKIRSLLDPSAADPEDASGIFFKDDGNELMKNLKVEEEDLQLDDDTGAAAGGAALPTGVRAAAAAGGAAGFRDILSGFKAAALNVLNFTTYFEMKARAGTVGKQGVAPLVDQLAPTIQRVHLVGHSFGGRVVSACAASSTTDRIASMSLLQSAFSHNGFSKKKKGFFRTVVDTPRITGPILVTHTPNDKAVGIAYPLASRISGDRTAAFGDKNDEFGGLGRNGAQQMESGETIDGQLLPAGSTYNFRPRQIFNLESSPFVHGHSDITGQEVAFAIRRAIV